MTILENQHLRLNIKNHGAELSSLYHKGMQTEYLWQADPTFWGRHAPVLFPIVGKLKENRFDYQGVSYEMKQHGLARNLDFECIEQTATKAIFSLSSTPETQTQYPFAFELQIGYELQDNKMINTYKVINKDTKTIYFSIGGHPAYRCPIHDGDQRNDYQLVFEQAETASTQRIDDGLRNGKTDLILNNKRHLPLTDKLFDEDALIFTNLNSNKVTLQKNTDKIWTFDFTGFPYLGIWSKNRHSPFVCIEPWFGVADHQTHNFDITKKEGIIALEKGSVFDCEFSVEIH